MKPGDLERNLTRLVEVAKAAQSCLAIAEGEVMALRLTLHAPLLAVEGTEPRTSAAPEAVSMEAAFK